MESANRPVATNVNIKLVGEVLVSGRVYGSSAERSGELAGVFHQCSNLFTKLKSDRLLSRSLDLQLIKVGEIEDRV